MAWTRAGSRPSYSSSRSPTPLGFCAARLARSSASSCFPRPSSSPWRAAASPPPFLPPRDQANALTSPFLHRLCSSVPTVALHPSRLASSTISLDRLIDESKGKFEKGEKRIVDAAFGNERTKVNYCIEETRWTSCESFCKKKRTRGELEKP